MPTGKSLSLITPIALLGLLFFQSTGISQNLSMGRTSNGSVGTMPISPKPWHEYEGPWMMKLNGRYYLFVAQGTSHDNDGQRAGHGLRQSYDVWVMSASTPYGPFGNRHLAFPYAGHNTVFQGRDGRWWSTWGASDRKQSVALPFYEKPAIIPIEMDREENFARQRPESETRSIPQ